MEESGKPHSSPGLPTRGSTPPTPPPSELTSSLKLSITMAKLSNFRSGTPLDNKDSEISPKLTTAGHQVFCSLFHSLILALFRMWKSGSCKWRKMPQKIVLSCWWLLSLTWRQRDWWAGKTGRCWRCEWEWATCRQVQRRARESSRYSQLWVIWSTRTLWRRRWRRVKRTWR